MGTWQRGTVVFIEGRAVWEGFLDWVALELGPDRRTDFYLSSGERTHGQKVQHGGGQAGGDQAGRAQEL